MKKLKKFMCIILLIILIVNMLSQKTVKAVDTSGTDYVLECNFGISKIDPSTGDEIQTVEEQINRVRKGDINLDGYVTTRDLAILKNIIKEGTVETYIADTFANGQTSIPPYEIGEYNADLNDDGQIDENDIAMLEDIVISSDDNLENISNIKYVQYIRVGEKFKPYFYYSADNDPLNASVLQSEYFDDWLIDSKYSNVVKKNNDGTMEVIGTGIAKIVGVSIRSLNKKVEFIFIGTNGNISENKNVKLKAYDVLQGSANYEFELTIDGTNLVTDGISGAQVTLMNTNSDISITPINSRYSVTESGINTHGYFSFLVEKEDLGDTSYANGIAIKISIPIGQDDTIGDNLALTLQKIVLTDKTGQNVTNLNLFVGSLPIQVTSYIVSSDINLSVREYQGTDFRDKIKIIGGNIYVKVESLGSLVAGLDYNGNVVKGLYFYRWPNKNTKTPSDNSWVMGVPTAEYPLSTGTLWVKTINDTDGYTSESICYNVYVLGNCWLDDANEININDVSALRCAIVGKTHGTYTEDSEYFIMENTDVSLPTNTDHTKLGDIGDIIQIRRYILNSNWD